MTTPYERRTARYALRVVGRNGQMVAAHLPAEMHGRPGTYGNHGCRCEDCTAGWAADARDRKRRGRTAREMARIRQAKKGLT